MALTYRLITVGTGGHSPDGAQYDASQTHLLLIDIGSHSRPWVYLARRVTIGDDEDGPGGRSSVGDLAQLRTILAINRCRSVTAVSRGRATPRLTTDFPAFRPSVVVVSLSDQSRMQRRRSSLLTVVSVDLCVIGAALSTGIGLSRTFSSMLHNHQQ